MNPTPYSYVTEGGALNTQPTASDPKATLADLYKQFGDPLLLDTPLGTYRKMSPKVRSEFKKRLPYFVGAIFKGQRHKTNVTAYTMLTLDIELKKDAPDEADLPPPFDVVAEQLEKLGVIAWMYTTISHRPHSPRYRIVIPLATPITGSTKQIQTALEATVKDAARALGLTEWCQRESWAVGQPMFLPAKLKGGYFDWRFLSEGRAWEPVEPSDPRVADIPDERPDPMLAALHSAGLYREAAEDHPGMHYITCPFHEQHATENRSKTVYYEAHFDGHERPGATCASTSHEKLTYPVLARWMKDEGHLSAEDERAAGVLDDHDQFNERARIDARHLDTPPPPARFAWDRFAPIGKVTVLAGPGGVSKSMLIKHLLAYGAMGRDWGPFLVEQPLKSLYVSYEDDTAEIDRRIHRIANGMRGLDDGVPEVLGEINQAILRNLGRYSTDDDAPAWVLMKKAGRNGAPERTPRVEWLIEQMRRFDRRVLVLDPVVYIHQLEENDAGEMAALMQTLTYIAKMADCAVVVLHHVNKVALWSSLADIHQGSLRGAGSVADASRSVVVMVTMPEKDAERHVIPAGLLSKNIVVLKHVKGTMSAKLETSYIERTDAALLEPRSDVKALTGEEAKEQKEQQRRDENLDLVERVLVYIRDHPGKGCNEIEEALDVTPPTRKKATGLIASREWATYEKRAEQKQFWSATEAGKHWLEHRLTSAKGAT